jgi:WD40 repeat protein
MAGVPLAARVVEVIADLGADSATRYRYGSGCRVSGRLVLTAAHVVVGAVSIGIRGPDKKRTLADVVLAGDPDGVDLALVELNGDVGQIAGIPMAVVDRARAGAAVVERCHAVGYPQFKDVHGTDGIIVRETADVYGEIPLLSGLVGGLLTLQVSSAPENLPDSSILLGESQWAGMSGAPVVAGEYLIGVVSEHAPREGASTITVTPLNQLDPDPGRSWPGVLDSTIWWTQLGVPAGLRSLPLLPAPEKKGTQPYLPTVREIRRRTPQLIARQQELAEIAAFATSVDGYRWMTGNAWAGKTALAAEAMITAMPPEVDVVAYFLSRRESDATSNHFLAVVLPQLAFLLGEEPPAPNWHNFLRLWEDALEAARRQSRHLLLIIDGLDEDFRPPECPSVAALLPSAVGGRGHVLVTSRPYPELPIDVPSRHPLRQTEPVPLEATEAADEQRLLAMQEVAGLLLGASDSATQVLGTMAAAAGPLATDDLSALLPGVPADSLRRFLNDAATRTVQRVGPTGAERYQFAHETLLRTCQQRDDLDVDARRQAIHGWVQQWRDADWPIPAGQKSKTPLYVLDTYPSTLEDQPERLAALVGDVGWVAAAVQAVGVDRVLANLGAAQSAGPANEGVSIMLSVLRAQAQYLRPPQPLNQPGYVLRQLCLQAAELADKQLAADSAARLLVLASQDPIPRWTTRWASRALALELGSHGGRVRAVGVLSRSRVVSGGDDGKVRVWDLEGGASPIELVGHRGIVRALAVLPGGRVVSGGDDRRILVWDPDADGAHAIELGHHGLQVRAVAAMPDGRVVTGGDDWRVLLWDPRRVGVPPIGLNGHRGMIRALAVLPDGRVLSAADDRRVLLWEPDTQGAPPVELGGHQGMIRALAVLPDGRVVSADDDGRIRIWNPATDSMRYRWRSGVLAGTLVGLARHPGRLRALAVLPDGRLISAGDDWMRVWDSAPTRLAPVELGCHDGMVRALAVLPGGQVVSGGEDRRVRVWDPSIAATPIGLGSVAGKLVVAAPLPDGRVVSGGYDGRVLVWDPTNGGAPIEVGRHHRAVGAVAVLPDGRVVSGGYDGRVLVWDPTNGGAPIEIGRHHRAVGAVAVMPDGRVVSGGHDRRVLVWDTAPVSGARLALPFEVGRHSRGVGTVAVLPDGRVLSGGEDGLILMWGPAAAHTDSIELGRHNGEVRALAVLPDGRVVSGGEDRRVRVWDPDSPRGIPVDVGSHDGPVLALVVLPDGRVVSGGEERCVRLWDVLARVECARVSCSAVALAVATCPDVDDCALVIVHEGAGISKWSIRVRLRNS